jgi:hypothetical protein
MVRVRLKFSNRLFQCYAHTTHAKFFRRMQEKLMLVPIETELANFF